MSENMEGKLFKVEHLDPVLLANSGRFGHYGYDIAQRLERTGKGRIVVEARGGGKIEGTRRDRDVLGRGDTFDPADPDAHWGHGGSADREAGKDDAEKKEREDAQERDRKRWESWDRGEDDSGDGTISPKYRRLLGGGKIRLRD